MKVVRTVTYPAIRAWKAVGPRSASDLATWAWKWDKTTGRSLYNITKASVWSKRACSEFHRTLTSRWHLGQAEAPPEPFSTVPFAKDPDYVPHPTLDIIKTKLREPSARVAIVGLGGVGLSVRHCRMQDISGLTTS